MAKEGGGIKNITQSGSGNAVTGMALSSDGKTITAVFGETFARQQDLGTLNNTVTQLSNKLNNFLEGSDADNIINKWKELEAFLDGLTESDNLAELLALKADKTITISAGTGLTGGGNLSANRTLSLATTGVNAGTYTKVTVDTYGRVTVGDNPTTLAGYGITDAVTLTTAQTISGRKTFSQNIVFNNNGGITYTDSNVVLRNSDGHTILASFGNGEINLRPNGHNNTKGAVWINKAGNVQAPSVSTNTITIGDAQLVYDSANKALRVKHRTDGNTVGFYSDGWVSALGVKTGGSGGGSGVVNTVYSFANLTDGTTFSDSDLDNTFNAYTIKKLYDMAGQGGLDADAMWAELKKADSSKVIDASHIPTSVLDGRWVKKAGDTMTGTLTSASTSGAIVFKGVGNCDITNIYKDNGVIKNDDGGFTSIRNGLRFNWYDTYWYIGNLRGSSTDSAGFGVVDHNNKLVLRVTPNDVRAPRFMSTVATGLSPLIVSSNTTVDNLSADLLDGYHAFGTSNALIKYGYTVGGTEPAWCRIATYSIRNTGTMTDVCFVLHSSFSDLFGLLVVRTRGTAVVEGILIASYNINRSNIRIYHDAEKKNIELYCYGGSNYSIIQANLLYSHDRNGGANTNITLYQADTKAPSWSTYVNPVFAPLQNSSEVAKKLQTPRTLWGQSFDGTANVSGNMTGVGNITMSGVLTIKNSTYNKQLIIWSAGSTAKNQGEGIWFRCNDALQEVVLRHEWYDTFVPGYGLAVSKHDSLEAGDANMFFYNTGRFIAKAPQGTSPYQCVSTTVNANLNADLLDGLHENSFLRYRDTYGNDGYNTLWSQIGIRQYNNAKPDGMTSSPYIYGAVISLPSADARFDIWYNYLSSSAEYGSNGIQYRSGWGDDKRPWRMFLDSVNYYYYADSRYVKKAGDTMTGDLTMNNTKGFNIGWSTRVVKTSSVWIHGGADAASSTDANLRFGSWNGIGWYPTISGQTVAQGNNAMWLNVRNGNLDTFGAITAHTNFLAANWDSARRLVLGGGSSYVWIESRNSSDNVLCNIVLQDNKVVIGNHAESSRFVSTVGTGTAPYQCVSTTVNANLNADLLDGLHENSFLRYRDTYGNDGYNTLWSQIGIRQYNNAKPDGMTSSPYIYGAVISLPSADARFDIWYNYLSSSAEYGSNGIQYRSGWGDDKRPWRMFLDSVNYYYYADSRYVKKAGDTMTGDLTMNNTKGFNIGWSTRVVKTSSVWIHGGADAASSTDANLRFGSWNGIGWYPTISGQTVAQGNNAMWLNVRNGNLDTFGAITAHTNFLAANWDSARRLVLGGGSSYVWIESRNSSDNVLCNIVLQDNKVVIGNHAESSRFVSTVGTGTAPYQCSSTTLNTNLNADMLDNWHIMDIPRNYNSTATYSLQFALGGTDNNWKKIFACSESGAGPYRSVTVWGRIWYAYGNHAQEEVRYYHFCAIFQMRSAPSASDSNVGNVSNSARLYLPTFAKGMDNIRLVRVGTNNFELQVRQIGSYHNGHIQYQYWAYGANVSAWRKLQSTSNTSVAVSAGGASTLADSRASSADVWTAARTFYIQDHDSSHTGAGVNVNGGSNVYLKLPSSIQCSDWFRSTGNSGWYHQNYGGGIYMQDSSWVRVFGGKRFYVENGDNTDFSTATAISTSGGIYARKNITSSANIIATGAITAKASSSDIRLKTDIQDYDAMGIIRKFRSVKYHWNNLAKRNSEIFNHKKWNYGLIAQDLLSGGYSQWVSDIFKDYYTIDYERLIPVVWKGLQEVDDEVTRLKKRVRELEKRLGIN